MKRPRLITRRRAKWVRRLGKWGGFLGKWGGVLAVVVLVATMIFSIWYSVQFCTHNQTRTQKTCINLLPGRVRFSQSTDQSGDLLPPSQAWMLVRLAEFEPRPEIFQYSWTPSYNRYTTASTSSSRVSIPLWMLIALIAPPTALLFYKDRRPKTGHCSNCRYNLAGLKDNRCPECGTEIPQAIESTPALGNGED